MTISITGPPSGRSEHAAKAIENAKEKFTPPPGVTADSLREAGRRADEIDPFLIDIDVVREIMRQANFIFDAEAYEQVRKMNDQVKAQAKHNPELLTIFQYLLDYFARGPAKHLPRVGQSKHTPERSWSPALARRR